jgi:hypothetical protein
MLNTNTNLFGFLLSQVGWSGDTATGRRRVTSQGWRNLRRIWVVLGWGMTSKNYDART